LEDKLSNIFNNKSKAKKDKFLGGILGKDFSKQ
jgi:hypothetical protein